MKNKKILLILVPVFILVIVLIISTVNNNKTPDDIQITTQKQEYITLGVDEKEYSVVGEDGKTYYIKPDGMYFENDGNLIKLKEYINIPVFNTYSYKYPNGNIVTITINKDATFKATTTYPNGFYQETKGNYTIVNGLSDTTDDLGMNGPEELAKSLYMPLPNLNPNNVYRIKLYSQESSMFNDKNEKQNYDHVEEKDIEDDEDMLFNDLLIVLDVGSSKIQQDNNGEYYPILCRGYSVSNGFSFTEYSKNGLISVKDNKYYVSLGGNNE